MTPVTAAWMGNIRNARGWLAAVLMLASGAAPALPPGADPHLPGLRWRAMADGPLRGMPTLDGDRVLVGSSDGRLYAYSRSDGAVVWSVALGAAVESHPALGGDLVFVTTRDSVLHALDRKTGKPRWHHALGHDTPLPQGWDQVLSAPIFEAGKLYVGGGDGAMYALDAASGKTLWQFAGHAPIRSTPTLSGNRLLFGGSDGVLFCLDAKTGKEIWKFRTRGADLDSIKAGYDVQTIIASPTVAGDAVYVGSRDGRMYAVALSDGHERWNVDYKGPWVVSTAAVAGDLVLVGNSDGHFIEALGTADGKCRWRTAVGSNVLLPLSLHGDTLYASVFGTHSYDYDADTSYFGLTEKWNAQGGSVVALNVSDGHLLWKQSLLTGSLSGVAIDADTLYVGDEDGALSAIRLPTPPIAAVPAPAKRAVYWSDAPRWHWFKHGPATREFFVTAGYPLLDDAALKIFLDDAIKSHSRSVVVFANDQLPDVITDTSHGASLLRQYLDAGGKAVWLSEIPGKLKPNEGHNAPQGNDPRPGLAQLGIAKLAGFGDDIPASITAEGRRWGLRHNALGANGTVPKDQVDTVLQEDIAGNASAWVKRYGGPEGSGFVLLWSRPDQPPDFMDVYRAAEFGLY